MAHRNPSLPLPSPSRTGILARLLPLMVAAGFLVQVAPTRAQGIPGSRPCLTSGVPAGYGTFLSLRSTAYQQAVGRAPAAASGNLGFEFVPPSAFSVTNVALSGPSSFKANLFRLANGTSTWSTNSFEANLLRIAPAGAYNASFRVGFTNGESLVGFFPFTLVSNTPPVPQIANLEAAQTIAANQGFSLQWNPWIGSGPNDRIELQIRDAAGQVLFAASSDCTTSTSLLPGATGIEIPAGRLAADTEWTGYLTFGGAQLMGTDDSSLMALRGFHTRTTSFPLRTRPAGGTTGGPGTLAQPTLSGTNLVFALSGTAGAAYAIESSIDLGTWTKESQVTIPASGSLQVTIPLPAGGAPRFYRATPIPGGGGSGGVTPLPATLAIASTGLRQLSLTVTGNASASYAIESSSDFATWTAVTNVSLPATPATASLSVPITVPAGADFLVYRARGVQGQGPETPVTLKPGTLRVTRSETSLTLTLSDATPQKSYSVEQHTTDWAAGTWTTTQVSITTDATGAGSATVPAPTAGGTAIFYRSVIR